MDFQKLFAKLLALYTVQNEELPVGLLKWDLIGAATSTFGLRLGKNPTFESHPINPDCTIKIAVEDLEAIILGNKNPQALYSLGKIQVNGDANLALLAWQLLHQSHPNKALMSELN